MHRCKTQHPISSIDTHIQGHLENLRGPGQDIKVGPSHDVMIALIEYLTVLLEYIDLLGGSSCPPVGGSAHILK